MTRRFLKYLNLLFYKLVLNYNTPTFFYILYFNFIKLRKQNRYVIECVEPVNNLPKFKIIDKVSLTQKYFCYRKQGLMAFGNGIFERGEDMGKAYLLDKIIFNNNDFIIDIGANTGDLKIYFENNNIEIDYLGFEPGLEEFKCLKLNNNSSNVLNIALGDQDTIQKFFYKPEFGDSSLVEMGDYAKIHEVEVKKLSTVFKKYNLENKSIKLIKLEAEGFEPEILIGLGDYIRNVEYISADLGFERGINQDTTAPEVLNYLIPLGFKIEGITEGRFCVLLKNSLYNKQFR